MKVTSKATNGGTTHSRLWVVALALTASLMAACGGGGGDGPCGGTGNLSLDVTYEVNGQLVDPTRSVVVTRGVPLLATPRAAGLPAACAADARWSFSARSEVPAGLNFNTTTGVISGTPTGRDVFQVHLRLSVVGYTADVRRTVSFVM